MTRTYLELAREADFRPSLLSDPAVTLERIAAMDPSAYRALYRDIGGAFHWRDRDEWSDALLGAHLARAETHVFLMRHGGEIAGYFELDARDHVAVEIVYLGLRARFIGRRLGGHMLTLAVQQAYALGASRVWLHTCTLDAPAALPNYRARGFMETRREQYIVQLPGEASRTAQPPA